MNVVPAQRRPRGRPRKEDDTPYLLTYQQLAERLGVPYGTVKRWANEGMPVDRTSIDRPLADPEAVDRWLATKKRAGTWADRRSVVYFAQRADGAVKIGFTDDVQRRLRELRPEHGPLELLATIPGDKRTEGAFHRLYAEARLDGEWFRETPMLRVFIGQIRRSEVE